MERKREKYRRVGIYVIDTTSEVGLGAWKKDRRTRVSDGQLKAIADENGLAYILVMSMREGRFEYPFPIEEYLAGWNQRGPRKKGWTRLDDMMPMRVRGAIERLKKLEDGWMPEEAEEAFTKYIITPRFLKGCGKSDARHVKWARRKKGGWGGARPNSGRPSKEEQQ